MTFTSNFPKHKLYNKQLEIDNIEKRSNIIKLHNGNGRLFVIGVGGRKRITCCKRF